MFTIISRWIVVAKKNVSYRFVWRIIAHILNSVTFFPENCAVCEMMWKNVVHLIRLQMAIGRMLFSCWILKASDTHSEHVMLIAFPRQQWLHEHAQISHLHVYCLSCCTLHLRYFLMFIGPCIIAIVDEWKTNLMSLAIFFHLLCAQHVSNINISIFRSLRLCW